MNREIKRRADVIGIFPNDAALVRLVGALMLEQNDEWAVSRRYMTLETLDSVSHKPVLSLQLWQPDLNPILTWINGSYTTGDTTAGRGGRGLAQRITRSVGWRADACLPGPAA